jgi:DnaJ-class molecular chaperone
MAYQKCPVCNGSGDGKNHMTNVPPPPCRTCSGTGIIDELTGAPPRYNRQIVPAVTSNHTLETFEEANRRFEQYGGIVQRKDDC